MNTNFKIYLVACSVMAVLDSCNKDMELEEIHANQNREARMVSMHARLGMDSRIAFDEDDDNLNLLWEENDAFSVMVGTAVQTPVAFTLTEGAGTANGSFKGEIVCYDGDTLYAVWPIMTEGMCAEHQCNWDLTGQKGTLDDQYTFMLGQGKYQEGQSSAMTFRYMTAAVRINLQLPEEVEKLTRVEIQVDGAYRKALVNIHSGGLIFDGGTNGGITIDNEFGVIDGEVNVVAYFFAWEYSALNNGKVVVTASNGKQYEGSLVNGNIRPGKLYDTTVVMSEVGLADFVEEEDGTYTVNTAKGWSTLVAMINAGDTFAGKTIKLGADINLNNELQEPIGLNGVYFAGTIDGQNHSIKNLRIDNTTGQFTGLFARVKGATFKNLRIAGGEVKGSGAMFVGAIAGYGDAITLINCHNEGCKVIQVCERNSGYAAGLVGSVNYINSQYSAFIACSNSAEVSGAYCPSGITGGGFYKYTRIVACVNTGKISYSGSTMPANGVFAAGIAGNFGGANANYMYGCFTDCEVVAAASHAALIADAGTSHPNLHYSYSANTSVALLGQVWGTPNKTIAYSTYNEAVEGLNKGIQMYNWSAIVPCTYQFVEGNKPTLIYAEPSTNPGAGNSDFGGGGKF